MKYLVTSAAALALSVIAVSAHAEEAFTLNKAQVGANLGYGIWTGDGDTNYYGLDLGVNGGYTLDMGLYVGARFDYFFGASDSVNTGFGSVETSGGIWNLMAEGGYDIGVAETVVVRPQLGLGMATPHAKACAKLLGFGEQCKSNSETDFALAPGAVVLADLGGFYVGGGLRYEHVFADGNADGLLIHGTGGLTF